MAIPTKYRDELTALCEGRLVLTVHENEPCLMLYPLPEWEIVERKLTALPSVNKQVQRYQRLLMGHATECDMDGNGRILLAPLLRKRANLEKEVVLVGHYHRFEIWSAAAWNEWNEENAKPSDESDTPEALKSFSF
jgi:MraZ protein